MTLYKLTTKNIGYFYVIAESPNNAINNLEILLKKADYGFYSHRDVVEISIITSEIYEFPNGIPNFSNDKHKLILPSTMNIIK